MLVKAIKHSIEPLLIHSINENTTLLCVRRRQIGFACAYDPQPCRYCPSGGPVLARTFNQIGRLLGLLPVEGENPAWRLALPVPGGVLRGLGTGCRQLLGLLLVDSPQGIVLLPVAHAATRTPPKHGPE